MANKRYDEFAATVPVAGNILLVEDTVLQTLGKFDVTYLLNNPDLIRAVGFNIEIGTTAFTSIICKTTFDSSNNDNFLGNIKKIDSINKNSSGLKHDTVTNPSFIAPASTNQEYSHNFVQPFPSIRYTLFLSLIRTTGNPNSCILTSVTEKLSSGFKFYVRNTAATSQNFQIDFIAIWQG